MKTTLLSMILGMLFFQFSQFGEPLPKKPLISEIAAYNLNNIQKLELGFDKAKVIELMGGNRVIKGYYSKDWKDYLTGLESISIPNPYKKESFIDEDNKVICILSFYAFPNESDKLIALKFEDNILIRIGSINYE